MHACSRIIQLINQQTLFFQNVNYERRKDDGLLLIFISELGIISSKQHRGHIRAYDGKFTGYNGNSVRIRVYLNNNPCIIP